MSPCDPITCGYAHGGECGRSCQGLQLHRPVLPAKLTPAANVERRSETPVPTAPLAVELGLSDDGLITLAMHTYKTHRALGRRKAFARAFASLFRLPVQPVNN